MIPISPVHLLDTLPLHLVPSCSLHGRSLAVRPALKFKHHGSPPSFIPCLRPPQGVSKPTPSSSWPRKPPRCGAAEAPWPSRPAYGGGAVGCLGRARSHPRVRRGEPELLCSSVGPPASPGDGGAGGTPWSFERDCTAPEVAGYDATGGGRVIRGARYVVCGRDLPAPLACAHPCSRIRGLI